MKVIECISKATKDYLNNLVNQSETHEHHYFLFGAGIVGLQTAAVLESRQIFDFCFLDNSPEKIGGEIDGHRIISFDEMQKEKREGDIIIVTVQNSADIEEQLTAANLVANRDFYVIPKDSMDCLLATMESDEQAEMLVFGDCSLINVSLAEKNAESIEELLLHNYVQKTQVICYNSLYAKSYWFILKKIGELRSYPRKVALWIDFETLNFRYGQYAKVQNYELIKEIIKTYPSEGNFDIAYKQEIEERLNSSIKDVSSPNRIGTDEKQRVLSQKNHFKLNYLYKYKEGNETEHYLDEIIKISKKENFELFFILAPVNIRETLGIMKKEDLNGFYGTRDAFKSKYEKLVRIVDVTELLEPVDFISHFSFNEGLRESGRRKVFDQIKGL